MGDSPNEDRFNRVLGLRHLTASGIGVIIGAGIYVLLGPATQAAGGLVWASFLVAGLLSALTAFSYMELASMFPSAGSEHEFARQVFPRWVSFTTGWAMMLALIVAASTVSLGFARYLQLFIDIDVRIGALFLLLLVSFIAVSGMKRASWLIIAFSSIQVGGLILVIVLGVDHVGDVNLLQGKGVSGVLAGSALIFFAFIGFDEVITLSEETIDARRTVPRALFIALALSTFLYVLVAIVSVSVLGANELALSNQPLTDVVRDAVGGGAVNVVTAIALVTTFNTTLLVVTAASRMMYGMASKGDLPLWFGSIRNHSSPRNSVVAALCGSSALLILGDIHRLAAATDALIYLMFLLVNVIVIVLRFRRPDDDRPFRIPCGLGQVPILPVLGVLATVVMASQLEKASITLAVALTAIGPVLFLVVRMRYGKQRTE
jgi:APA family basic amino acid/polyamine antiporter